MLHYTTSFARRQAAIAVGYVFACNRQIKGSVADVDGQLVPGDQILVVNGVDIRSSQQQDTAAMLKVL